MVRQLLQLVEMDISKWVYRDISQEVCPWNVKFARAKTVPEFAPREFIADKDAATLARDLFALTPQQFSAAFRGSRGVRELRCGLLARDGGRSACS